MRCSRIPSARHRSRRSASRTAPSSCMTKARTPPNGSKSVNFQVAWPSISRSFGANGRFVWNDEPVEASLTLSDFLAALTGDRSGVKLRHHQRAAQCRLRRCGDRSADAEARRHARRRVALAARRLALDRQEQGAVRRLRPLCASRAERYRRRHGVLVQRQCRTRRQQRRRRADAGDRRPSAGARHACRRCAGSDALCFRRAASGPGRKQLGPPADRAQRL